MRPYARLSLLILAALTLLSSAALAQPSGVAAGTVVDAHTGTPLPGANVFLVGTRLGDVADAQGRFSIATAAGSYQLAARLVGFAEARARVVVLAGDTVRVTFALNESLADLPEIVVAEVSITGGAAGVSRLPGASTYVGPRALDAFAVTDIARALRQVPGVNVQEEDGYGLRPNIGLRGTGSERSSKITVMEDGVLMAPAPYAAPAAYYFPTVGRMEGIEVRKGSSQIAYGPYTTGGALNLISTAIPERAGGQANVLAGGHAERQLHGWIGGTRTVDALGAMRVGALVEGFQTRSDGFKDLDGGGTTGFDKRDGVAKLSLSTRPTARIYQALTLKAGFAGETSDETYLGLTAGDFDAAPFRRYSASQVDQMDTEQRQMVARYHVRPTSFLSATATAYRTDFSRNWYKLDKVKSAPGARAVGISSLLDDPAADAGAYAVLTGATSLADDALAVKANNREYYAQGVQATTRARFGSAMGAMALVHEIEASVRIHRDQIDRFQWVDAYRMDDGVMTRTAAGTPGTESNRVETADAVAAYAQYTLQAGPLTLVPGLRYETIRIEREDYGKADPGRAGTDLVTRANEVDVWIPGVGVALDVGRGATVFGGVHRGFSPPGSKEGTEPEQSVSIETGFRLAGSEAVLAGARLEAVGFINAYDNLLGADLAASGGSGTTDLFNGGEALARGLEVSAEFDLARLAPVPARLPLSLAYTFTEATFSSGFDSEFEPWGSVSDGDHLPYVPAHQLAATLRAERARGSLSVSARYGSAMRTVAGQGAIPNAERIPSHLTWDAAVDARLTPHLTAFASLRNVTDEAYIVARRPAGLRPGLPRTVLFGIKTTF